MTDYYEEETGAYSYAPEDDMDGDDFPPDEDGEDGGEDGFDGEPRESNDLTDDGDALASVGWGTDEDYGYDGGDEW